MPFPPSKNKEFLEKEREGPSQEEIFAHLQSFYGEATQEEVEKRKAQFDAMTPKQKLAVLEHTSKLFKKPHNPEEEHPTNSPLRYDDFQEKMKDIPDEIKLPENWDTLTHDDIVRALKNESFRKVFQKAADLDDERIESMITLFSEAGRMSSDQTMLSSEKRAAAIADMEKIMEDLAPKPQQNRPGSNFSSSSNTSPLDDIEEKDSSPPPRTSSTASSSSPSSSFISSEDNFTRPYKGKSIEKIRNRLSDEDSPKPPPRPAAETNFQEIFENLGYLKPNASTFSPSSASASSQSTKSSSSPSREASSPPPTSASASKSASSPSSPPITMGTISKTIYDAILDKSLGGLDVSAPVSYNATIDADRARWLGRQPEDLRIAEMPMLLVDFHQLAAEAIFLRERNSLLEQQLKAYERKYGPKE